MRYSAESLTEKYKVLPKGVRDMAKSLEVSNTIKAISEKHNLHIDIAEILYDEITYVMFGAEKATDFIRNLKIYLKLPDEKVNAIAKDVNEKIFLPIREALKKVADTPAQSTAQPSDIIKPEVPQSTLHQKEEALEDQINHPPLSESEEIKEQVKAQQEVKPQAPLPENLPSDEPVDLEPTQEPEPTLTPKTENQPAKTEKKEERHIQKQSPYAKDPYREPIE